MLLLCFWSMNAQDQYRLQNQNWVMGTRNIVNFTANSPITGIIPFTNTYGAMEGVASVSDRQGNLLFYTDGVRVFDGNHVQIASGLLGNRSSTQNVIIIPRPNHHLHFYIVTIVGKTYYPTTIVNENMKTKGLYYSEIDMNKPSPGLVPGVINIPLLGEAVTTPVDDTYNNDSEAITATLHSDPNKYWLIANALHANANGYVFSYEVTENNITLSPRSTTIMNTTGFIHTIKIAPNRQKIAIAGSMEGLYLGTFNDSNGNVTIDSVFLDYPNELQTYGVEFSKNSDVLYYTGLTIDSTSVEMLPPPINSFTRVNLNNMDKTVEWHPGALGVQRAVNDTIYIARSGYEAQLYSEILAVTDPQNVTNPYIVDQVMAMPRPTMAGFPQLVPKQHCERYLFDNQDIMATVPVWEQRTDSIRITNKIENAARAIYHSGGFIELLPDANSVADTGFEAVFGSQFVAEIAPCDSTFTYTKGITSTETQEKTTDLSVPGKIKVFPNPSNKRITVSYDSPVKRIAILSMDGKTILNRLANENELELDVSAFVNGIYIITVETQNGQFLQSKFIKN